MNYDVGVITSRRLIARPSSYFAAPAASAAAWAGVTSGLTHHWPMADANVSGTNITDIVGSLNGTATGSGVTSAAGPGGASGTARQFNAVDTISFASPVFASLTGDSTCCIWIYTPDVTVNSPDGGIQGFLNFTDFTDVVDLESTPGASPTTLKVGSATGVTPARDTSAGVFTSNTWLHFAWTFPSGGPSSSTLLYVNGALVSSTTTTAVSGQASNLIGGRTPTRRLPNGARIGRLLTYTRVLSAGEILQNYNAL